VTKANFNNTRMKQVQLGLIHDQLGIIDVNSNPSYEI